jgi:hypothetical protein
VRVEPSLELGDRDQPTPAHPDRTQVRNDVLVKEVDRDTKSARGLLLTDCDPRYAWSGNAHDLESPRGGWSRSAQRSHGYVTAGR